MNKLINNLKMVILLSDSHLKQYDAKNNYIKEISANNASIVLSMAQLFDISYISMRYGLKNTGESL